MWSHLHLASSLSHFKSQEVRVRVKKNETLNAIMIHVLRFSPDNGKKKVLLMIFFEFVTSWRTTKQIDDSSCTQGSILRTEICEPATMRINTCC